MDKMLSKLMNKSEDVDPKHSDAKMQVLEELRDMASKMMGEKMGDKEDMQEVSVAAPDSEGLHEGLEMAQELLPEKSDEMSSDSQFSEDDDMDLEEIESLIRELEAKRREKLMNG